MLTGRVVNLLVESDGALRPGWKALLFMVAYGIVASALEVPVVIVGTVLKLDLRPLLQIRFGPVLNLLAALALTAAFLAIERRPLRSVGYHLNRLWWRQTLLGTLGGMALMGGVALLLFLAGGFHWTRNPVGSWAAQLRSVGSGFLIFLVVALYEETVYRGYPFQRLRDSVGDWPAQLVFAGWFAMNHWGNPGIHDATTALKVVTTLNIALAAVLLGVAFLKTRSLALPIGIHFGWNWAQGNLLGFPVSGTKDAQGFWTAVLHGKPSWFTGGAVGLEGSLLCALVVSVVILGLLAWKPKAQREV